MISGVCHRRNAERYSKPNRDDVTNKCLEIKTKQKSRNMTFLRKKCNFTSLQQLALLSAHIKTYPFQYP